MWPSEEKTFVKEKGPGFDFRRNYDLYVCILVCKFLENNHTLKTQEYTC